MRTPTHAHPHAHADRFAQLHEHGWLAMRMGPEHACLIAQVDRQPPDRAGFAQDSRALPTYVRTRSRQELRNKPHYYKPGGTLCTRVVFACRHWLASSGIECLQH